MHVVIMGCGRVGAFLAEKLATDNHRVFMIEPDRRRLEALPRSLVNAGAITVVEGDGTSSTIMTAAEAEEAEVFIAVSGGDTLNGLAALKAKNIFRVKRVVCRVRDDDLRQMYGSLGLTVVNSTQLVSDRILAAMPETQ